MRPFKIIIVLAFSLAISNSILVRGDEQRPKQTLLEQIWEQLALFLDLSASYRPPFNEIQERIEKEYPPEKRRGAYKSQAIALLHSLRKGSPLPRQDLILIEWCRSEGGLTYEELGTSKAALKSLLCNKYNSDCAVI